MAKCDRCQNEARPNRKTCASCAARHSALQADYREEARRATGVHVSKEKRRTARENAQALEWLIERGYRAAGGST